MEVRKNRAALQHFGASYGANAAYRDAAFRVDSPGGQLQPPP